MEQILKLREKRAKAWEDAKAFLDSRRGQDDLISPEDEAVYDKMETEVINLGKEIERLERQAVIDRELAQATTMPIKNAPSIENGKANPRATKEYNDAFWKAIRSKHGYEVMNALRIGEESEGGYLVPDEFERTLVQALEEENVFRSLAKVITTSSGDRKIPIVISKGEATWVDEEGPIQESDDSFGQAFLSAHKVATMIKVSEELLNDSAFDLPSYIATEFGRRIGNKEEEAFFVGDGEGKPTGIFDDDGGGELGTTAASATAVTFDEIFDLFYSLRAPYRKRAHFIMNDSTVKLLRKLKDNNGQYIWQPSVAVGQPDTILSRPLVTSPYVPEAKAGEKAIAFGDFGYYWIADRQGRNFKRLNELYAVTGQVGFIATQRVDGKLILPESIKYLQMKAS